MSFFTIEQLCERYQFSDSYIRRRIRAGDFGPRTKILQVGRGVLRVPASGVAFFEERFAMEHPVQTRGRKEAA